MDAKEHQEREECGLVVFSGRLPQLPLTEQNISVANDDHDDQVTSTKIQIEKYRYTKTQIQIHRFPQLPLTEQNISVANDDHDDQVTSTKIQIEKYRYTKTQIQIHSCHSQSKIS